MVKKIAALAGAGAILLSMAVPAFAHYWWWGGDTAIIKDNAVVATANTGGNSQSTVAVADNHSSASVSGSSGARSMVGNTGNAYAEATGVIVANVDVKCGRRCGGYGGYEPGDKAVVKGNFVAADANTGDNLQDDMALATHSSSASVSGSSGARSMNESTGVASAKAKGFVIVNTDLSFGGFHPYW